MAKVLVTVIALISACAIALGAVPVPGTAAATMDGVLSSFGLHRLVVNQPSDTGDRQLQTAFERQQSNLQVKAYGTVDRLLPDDREGSQHQRFIVRMPSGLTILIAHNIDLAPRVQSIRKGDSIRFFGEYEWTSQGGVVHWTHADPNGHHVDGWIEHRGKRYQ